MRRMTSAEIRKENRPFLFFAALLFICGFGLLLIPRAYTPVSYDALQETTETVFSVRGVFDVHGLSLQIVTADGEKYTLAGTYELSEVRKTITSGDEVTIRYYQDLFSRLFRARYAAEVTKNGETVVSFGGKRFVRFPWLRLLAALFILVGVGFVVLWRDFIHRREEQERMRDRRIEKKYGSINRDGPKKMGKKRRK